MTGTLPDWLARLLDIDTASSGEGTAWSLQHAWSWPPWATVLLVAALAGVVFVAYLWEIGSARRLTRIALATIRVTLLSLVLLMIAQWVIALDRTDLPFVIVMVDDSKSMATVDRYDEASVAKRLQERVGEAKLGDASRWNIARSLLREDDAGLMRAIGQRYKLKTYLVADDARSSTGTVGEVLQSVDQTAPTGKSSRLGDGIRSALADLRGSPVVAVILITDGINTDGRSIAEAAAYCRRKGTLLFTVGVGSDQRSRDVRVSDLVVDDVVFVDDVVTFQAYLTQSGLAGKRVELVLREKGKTAVLARRTVALEVGKRRQLVRISYRPTRQGAFEYVVEARPLAEETDRQNNRSPSRVVTVRKQEVRVLLAQSYPSFEFRYLKHLLGRERTVKLTTVLQEGDLQYASQDDEAIRVFPVRREELFAYDVIILGDVDPRFLSRSVMNNIGEFVKEKGGGLVMISGPRFMPAAYRDLPLAKLMPLDISSVRVPDPQDDLDQGFRVKMTELGEAVGPMQLGDTLAETDRIWAGLPEMYWALEIPSVSRDSLVFARHSARKDAQGQNLSLIFMRHDGPGKVLFHAIDSTWLWRGRVGDKYFGRYWVQMIRFLARSKVLSNQRSAELTTDEKNYDRPATVRLRLRFFDEKQAPTDDASATVVLEREGVQNRTVQLRRHRTMRGIFEARITNLGDGKYHARVATPSFEKTPPFADFVVGRQSLEDRLTAADNAALARAADQARGRFFNVGAGDDSPADILDLLPEGQRVAVRSLPSRPLWNHWLVALVFLSLICTEWVLRKYCGML